MPDEKLIIGCGYVGRRAARQWVAAGDVVHALTRSEAHAEGLRAIGVRPVIGNVMEPQSLAVLPRADTVLYAVGLDRGPGKSQREVYVDGLANVLARIAAPRPKLLYLSSTSVYGQNSGEWVDETSELRPASENGQVCLDAERLLIERLPSAMILRLSGIYGPGRLVARLAALREGKPLDDNPDGWLNLIHVDDIVTAILACERLGQPGAAYLVSDDRPSQRREYYERLASLIDAPPPTFTTIPPDSPEQLQLNKRCRNRRLHEELGVALRYPTIAEGLPAALSE